MLLCCCVFLQVRTVAAFGMEQGTVDKYDQALEYPERVSPLFDVCVVKWMTHAAKHLLNPLALQT